jgi:RNA polymerase sigma factor (sigma-70 family)
MAAATELSPEDQASLAERVRQGDREAESRIAEAFYERALIMVRARTRRAQTAPDLAQEAWLGVIRALREGRVEDPSNLGAFIHGVTRNVVNNWFRRGMSRDEPLDAIEVAAPATLEFERAARKRLVRRALESVREPERSILHMAFVLGLEAPEIAARLKLSADAVRQRKSRALHELRDVLDPSSHS